MIIEIGAGLMTLIVIVTIFTLIIAPELVFLLIVFGSIVVVGAGSTGTPITIKGPEGIIFSTTNADINVTKVKLNE